MGLNDRDITVGNIKRHQSCRTQNEASDKNLLIRL